MTELKKTRKMQLVEYKGTYVSDLSELKDLPSFKCRDDDLWVCSFPRSGTTLTQQLAYLIMTLDFEKATAVNLDERFPLAADSVLPDRRGTIKKIADFLGKDLSDEKIDKIMDHTSLEGMKNNRSVNLAYFEEIYTTDKTDGAFINKGEVSGWKHDLSDDLIAKMDELIKNELKDTDIVYE